MLLSVLPFGVRAEVLCGKNTMIRKGFADGPQRLYQRGIGQVEGRHEGEPWLHLRDRLFIGRYSRGVGKQQALARSKNRTNLQRRFRMLPSGLVSMDPLQTSFFQLLTIGSKMVGPGASEIVLDLATVALVDGALIFIFSAIFLEVGTFHLAFDTDAFSLSSTGDVASVKPVIFNGCCPGLGRTDREPLGSLRRFHESCFQRHCVVVASTDGSKIIGITAGGVMVAITSGQSDRVNVLAPGSIVCVARPTDLAYESEVSVFAEHETGLRLRPLLCQDVRARVHRLRPPQCRCRHRQKRDQTMNGWRRPSKRVSLSVLSMMRWLVWWPQDDFEENHLPHVWSRSERMSRCFRPCRMHASNLVPSRNRT